MSSPDNGRGAQRFGASILFALVSALLSACTVQPLYGPTASGVSVQSALNRIVIDPVDTRIAQEIRNKLLFELTGSEPAADAIYRMKLTVSSSELPLGVTRQQSAPSYSVTVVATYEVSLIASGEIIFRSTSRASAAYDRVNQVYANVRAKLDAENRAASIVADDIRIRVAAAAARGL